jgi:hypothetical protein
MKFQVLIYAMVLGAISPVMAQFNFQGYRQVQVTSTTKRYDLVQIGRVSLENVEMTLVAHGAYLDVTQDAWISGNLENTTYTGLTNQYVMNGTFSLPVNAVVVGMSQEWQGRYYKCQLYPAKYEQAQSFTDSATLVASLRSSLGLLQQNTTTSYNVMLTQFAVGEVRHVRIRYLLWQTSHAGAPLNAPILFNSQIYNPQYVKFHFSAAGQPQSFSVETSSGKVLLNEQAVFQAAYRSSFDFTPQVRDSSAVLISGFPSGDWSGYYMALNARVADTVFKKLSRPLEAAWLWRWNKPFQFVTRDYNGLKTLSTQGQQLADQARAMKTAMDTLVLRGYRVSLRISREGEPLQTFSLGGSGDASWKALRSYLDTLDEQHIFAAYPVAPSTPSWVPTQVGAASQTSAAVQEFRDAITAIRANFSTDTVTLKHVLVMSVGTPLLTSTGYTSENAAQDFSGLTVDFHQSMWAGIPEGTITSLPGQSQLFSWLGFLFPQFVPVSVNLKVRNGTQAFGFTLNPQSQQTFSALLKSSTAWGTTLEWVGLDKNGRSLRSVQTNPSVLNIDLDSGLAKLWAGNPNRVSETTESNLTYRYGIVTKEAVLRASVGDPSSSSSDLTFLSTTEIHAPVGLRALSRPPRATIAYHAGAHELLLFTPILSGSAFLEIRDAAGRLVVRLRLNAYQESPGVYRVPLPESLGRMRGILFCRLWSGDETGAFRVLTGLGE